jgi:hypothetical protein
MLLPTLGLLSQFLSGRYTRQIVIQIKMPPAGDLQAALKLANALSQSVCYAAGRLIAFCTRPDRKQSVHTRMRRTLSPTCARTRWIFGSQRRLRRLFAWLTWLPTPGDFPQTAHLAMIVVSFKKS